MANTELEVEFERLEHSLGKAKGIGEKDKVLGRFLNRASSQQEYNIKARGQKPRVRKRGGTVSRRKGSAVASKKRKKSIPYPRKFPDDPGAAHPDYEQKNPYLKGKQKKAKGGTVSRRSGGKIMQGYKAGGKV